MHFETAAVYDLGPKFKSILLSDEPYSSHMSSWDNFAEPYEKIGYWTQDS